MNKKFPMTSGCSLSDGNHHSFALRTVPHGRGYRRECTIEMMKEDQPLLGFQRAALMRQAHSLRPVASIGQKGPTEELKQHIDRELENHELIKIRYVDYKGQAAELTEAIASDLGAIVVATIGHVGILFRRRSDPASRIVEIPTRSSE